MLMYRNDATERHLMYVETLCIAWEQYKVSNSDNYVEMANR